MLQPSKWLPSRSSTSGSPNQARQSRTRGHPSDHPVRVTSEELTAANLADEARALEGDLLRALMDEVPDFVYFKDTSSRFLHLNRPAAMGLGLSDPAAAIGKTDADLLPDVGPDWVAEEQHMLSTGTPIINRLVEQTTVTGERRWILTNKAPIRDRDGAIVGLVGIGRDVTERQHLEGQLAHQALHDPLTALPNRTLFQDRLAHALIASGRRPGRVAVFFIDLDRFKVINDLHGHDVGDAVLVTVAQRLAMRMRGEDTLARLGGDEFGAVLEQLPDEAGAVEIAARLLQALDTPIYVAGKEFLVDASIGVAVSQPETSGPGELLRQADVALYQAKSAGRSQAVLFEARMVEALAERSALEAELRVAVEQSAFTLHYQPITDLRSGVVCRAEALLRWESPTRGGISPAICIPIAEEAGLIVPLSRWVLETACHAAVAWQSDQDPGEPFVVSVNISARQFREPDFVAAVATVLRQSGLPPQALQLEITEQVVMDEGPAAAQTLAGLKALGIRLAIDDFGTGFSSLAYLRHLPVDVLKIDQSFVRGLGHEPGSRAIVESVVAMAHALGLTVTAEGVETAGQVAELRALGCDRAQGFYFGHPAPGDPRRGMPQTLLTLVAQP